MLTLIETSGVEKVVKKKRGYEDQYLSIPTAAAILGISRTALFKLVKKGDIRSIKIGRNYAIPQSSLAELHGGSISPARKKRIIRAVRKVVKEYGELLEKLGNE